MAHRPEVHRAKGPAPRPARFFLSHLLSEKQRSGLPGFLQAIVGGIIPHGGMID
jgi:hypothetical protein